MRARILFFAAFSCSVVAKAELPLHPEERMVVDMLIEAAKLDAPPESNPREGWPRLQGEPSLRLRSSVGKRVLLLGLDESGRVKKMIGNGPLLSNESIRLLVKLPSLISIRLDHNTPEPRGSDNIEDYDGSGWAALANSRLEEIKIGHAFDDDGMAALAKIQSLRIANIGHSRVTDAGIAHLIGHPHLEEFAISSQARPNRITDQSLAHLAKIPNLKRIGLHETFLTYDKGLRHWKGLRGKLEFASFKHALVLPEDVAKLKADHPDLEIETSAPKEILASPNSRGVLRWASTEAIAWLQSQPEAIPAKVLFLAVGPGGHRMFSPDGLHWEKHASWGEPKHDQNDLNVAAFFRGMAFAGGGYFSGRLAATSDGEHWSEGVLPGSAPIFGLEVLNDTFYAVTLRGQVYASKDGSHWNLEGAADMPSKTHWIRQTVTGNGVIVGSGDFGPAMRFDPKSRTITVTQMVGQVDKNATWKRVAFGNGVFVVGGQDGLLAWSSDGTDWHHNEVHPERGDITAVAWLDHRFIAVSSEKKQFESVDGKSWKEVEATAPKMMVRAGSFVFGWAWPPSKLLRTTDGIQWHPVANERGFYVKHIAIGELTGSGSPPSLPPPSEKKEKRP